LTTAIDDYDKDEELTSGDVILSKLISEYAQLGTSCKAENYSRQS
jgi:hypothetical protein